MKVQQLKVIWRAQPGPQSSLIECPIFEVFYGGARGGGKTEGSVGDWLQHSAAYGVNATGVFFRRTSKQLEEVVARTKILFPQLGASYKEQRSEWTMSNGARLKFRYLERDKDAEEYQGHSYTRVYVEEVTNFPSPEPINKLRATVRSAAGVPCGMRLTGNPGGPGHNWVKARYIDPAPGGYKVLTEFFSNPFKPDDPPIEVQRVFIPSRLSDNPLLMENDPGYIARLQQQGSQQLVDAWLKGDWDVILGAFFDCFSVERHVLSREWLRHIPAEALRFRAFDWGSAKPFCVGWYAVSDGSWGLPAKALVKYREWYGAAGVNVGLKMVVEQVAIGIREREKKEVMKYGVADPSIFQRDGGPSKMERMLIKKVAWRPADNKRIAGWDIMRHRLVGENGVPMIYFVEDCEATIRTIPIMQHDETDPEDLDSEAEDHAVDETRYACMSRPWLPKNQPEEGFEMEGIEGRIIYPKLPAQMTINDLVKRRTRKRLRMEAA